MISIRYLSVNSLLECVGNVCGGDKVPEGHLGK